MGAGSLVKAARKPTLILVWALRITERSTPYSVLLCLMDDLRPLPEPPELGQCPDLEQTNKGSQTHIWFQALHQSAGDDSGRQ
jgi:hypothetical protein